MRLGGLVCNLVHPTSRTGLVSCLQEREGGEFVVDNGGVESASPVAAKVDDREQREGE